MSDLVRALGVLAVAVWVAAGVGCDTVKAPPEGAADELHAQNYPRIVASDGLKAGLRFGDVIVEHETERVPMRVTVPVRSVVDAHSVNIQYRFEFFGADGRLMADPREANWRFRKLEPRIQGYLEGGAKDLGAVDWRLVVRSAR